jgi:hypothetical protein
VTLYDDVTMLVCHLKEEMFYMVLMLWMCDGGILNEWMGLAICCPFLL